MDSTGGDHSPFLVDAVERLGLSREHVSRFHNDLNARASLWAGLELLYAQTRQLEQNLASTQSKDTTGVVWGNIPGVPLRVLWQVACFFDWYSVSACNFVSLTGWIAKTCGITAENHAEYRREIVPQVLAHRNKIGAHAARVCPRGDSMATQEASNFRQLALVNDRLVANSMVFYRKTGGQSSNSRVLEPWSLTETHEILRSRYDVIPEKARNPA